MAATLAFSESTKKNDDDDDDDDNDNDNRTSHKIRRSSKMLGRSSLGRSSIAVLKDNVNFGIPSKMSVLVHAVDNHGEDSWNTRVLEFIHKKWVQMTLMGLLVLDLLIIFTELSLMIEFPPCRIITRDCIACCGIEDLGGGVEAEQQNHTERWLSTAADEGGEYGEICPTGYDETGEAGCDENKYEGIHIAEEVLFYFTVSILVLFLIENLVEMAALGICTFFKQIFLAMDFIVVLVSLILELTFHLLHSELAQLVGILVMFRIWRFVRIGHGIIEITSELTNEYYESLIKFSKACEEKLKANNIEPPEKSKDVEEILDSHGHD